MTTNSKSRNSKSRNSPLSKSLNKYIDYAIAEKINEIMQKKINDKHLTPRQIKRMEEEREKEKEKERIADEKYDLEVKKALGYQKPSIFGNIKRTLLKRTFRGGKGKKNNKSKTRKNK